ncbi:MAG TPA: lysine exporter LysO family protein [Thermoplasmata archaeon]|nr:lysine exporter LysO family protein [Thermoplasmata archaeon]
MAAFDPLLYIAFAIGFLLGRLVPGRSPWIGRATQATIVVLVALLGATLDTVPAGALAETIPVAAGFALLVLGLTAGAYLLLERLRPGPAPSSGPGRSPERFPLSVLLLAALVAGFLVGRLVSVPAAPALPWVLYVLLALVGFDIHLEVAALRGVWRPLAAAASAAVVAAVAVAWVGGLPLGASLATTLAFGFYSLAGPLVAARAGAVLGLLAFLTNFLREDLTMLLSPYVGRRLRGPGLTALGGATSMDTTLYFVTRYGDGDSASLALASGLVLTIAASLLLPAVLSLPV